VVVGVYICVVDVVQEHDAWLRERGESEPGRDHERYRSRGRAGVVLPGERSPAQQRRG
jgi:hypothetical protein